MKRVSCILGIVLLLGVAVGLLVHFSSENGPSQSTKIVERKWPASDYAPVDLRSMTARNQLVVIGTYLGKAEGGYSLSFAWNAVTYARLSVDQVIKGECGDELNFYYFGGEYYIRDVIRKAEQLGLDRNRFSFWPEISADDEEADVIVRCYEDEHYIKPEIGKKYLFFFTYQDLLLDGWLVDADMYGCREINERGQVYNPVTGNYDTIVDKQLLIAD